MSSQLDPGEVTEDLKAFERRLTEYIACLHPKAIRWRIVLAMSSVCTAVSAWYWITDEATAQFVQSLLYIWYVIISDSIQSIIALPFLENEVTFLESLWTHRFFSGSILSFVLLLLIGIHKRVREPQIILKRCRLVLEDYNMSCDDRGRLILKPRPS